MIKLSGEATIGLVFEVLVGILDHLHVREPYIIWGLFVFGLILIGDSIVRGEWAEKISDQKKRTARRILYGVAAALCFIAFGIWIFARSHMQEPRSAATVLLSTQSPFPASKEPEQEGISKVNEHSIPVQPGNTQKPLQPTRAPHPPMSQQDNSVHLGAGAAVEQQSKGPCSPNIIGGSSTVNCAPRPRIPDSQIASLSAQLALCSSGSTTASPNVVNPSGSTEQDAENLASAFAKTRKWKYSGVTHGIKGQDIGPDGPIPEPVGIHIYSDATHKPLANCVQDALKFIGVESVIEPKEDQGNSLSILVGNIQN